MVMNPNTLASELENLVPTVIESVAAQRLADAYEVFALDAIGNGVPILPSGPAAGKSAMIPALTGMSAPGAAASIIGNAVVSFWAAAATPAAFPGSIAVVPPPNANLASLLPSIFNANTAGNLSLVDAVQVIASTMHAEAIIGGTVTLPGPVVGPIL